MMPQGLEQMTVQHKSVGIFVRIWTLFKVLFLPDLDFDALLHRNATTIDSSLDVFSEKTRQEVSKYKIKSYSVAPETTNAQFKYSYEQVSPDQVAQNRPEKITDIQMQEQHEAQDVELGIHHYTATDEKTTPTYTATLQQQEDQLLDIKTEQEHTLPLLNNLKKKINFNEFNEESTRINNLTDRKSSDTADREQSVVETVENLPMHYVTLQSESTSRFSLADIMGGIGRLVSILVLSIPIIIVIATVIIFLSQNTWSLSKMGNYPTWISTSIENFVRNEIVKRIR